MKTNVEDNTIEVYMDLKVIMQAVLGYDDRLYMLMSDVPLTTNLAAHKLSHPAFSGSPSSTVLWPRTLLPTLVFGGSSTHGGGFKSYLRAGQSCCKCLGSGPLGSHFPVSQVSCISPAAQGCSGSVCEDEVLWYSEKNLEE